MQDEAQAGPGGGPVPLGPEQTYFAYLHEGEWRIQQCRPCGRAVFYPRLACPHCEAQDFDWISPAGRGTIYATTVMRRGVQAGGDLNLCLVDLDEGVRMMSRVEGVDPAAPRVGDRVRARLRRDEGASLVVFELMEAGA